MPEKCIMCAGAHPASKHQCRVDGCKMGKEDYVSTLESNAPIAEATTKEILQKAEIQARQKKAAKNLEPTTVVNIPPQHYEDVSPKPETEIDLEAESWAKSPSEEGLDLEAPESQDQTQNY